MSDIERYLAARPRVAEAAAAMREAVRLLTPSALDGTDALHGDPAQHFLRRAETIGLEVEGFLAALRYKIRNHELEARS